MSTIRDLEKRVGEEVGVSPWVEITQERIDTFAKAIEDFQWIHVDAGRAKQSPFGRTIAHGFLTLSLLSHLSEQTFSFSDRRMGINYGLNRVRFICLWNGGGGDSTGGTAHMVREVKRRTGQVSWLDTRQLW